MNEVTFNDILPIPEKYRETMSSPLCSCLDCILWDGNNSTGHRLCTDLDIFYGETCRECRGKALQIDDEYKERHFSAALDPIKELEARLEQYESKVERMDTPEEAEKKRDDLALKELKSGKVVEYYEHDFGTHACFAIDVEDKNNKDASYSEEFPYVDPSKPVTGDLLVHVDADTCFIFDRAEDGVYYAKTGLGYKPECFKKTGFFIDEDGLPKRRVL